MKAKIILVAEFFAVAAVAGALVAASGIDPNSPTVTAKDAVGAVAAGALGAAYAAARLIAPAIIGILADAKDALFKQITG